MTGVDAAVVIVIFTALGALSMMAIASDNLVGAGALGGILGFVVGLVACVIINAVGTKDTTKKSVR